MDDTAQGILAVLEGALYGRFRDDFDISSIHRDSTGALVVEVGTEDPTARREYRVTIEHIGG